MTTQSAVPASDASTLTRALWTHRQRQACSLHEISYRACFKAELPRYFISQFSKPTAVVYDPFGGRGTTGLEAALLGRTPILNDVNPLTRILTAPRLVLPELTRLSERIAAILHQQAIQSTEQDLSMFFHEQTLQEILCIRQYLRRTPQPDCYDDWIRMLVTTRLTGHSRGFLSVYTLPPNQATSAKRQQKLNQIRQQIPPYRNVHDLILRKAKSLLRNISDVERKNLAGIQSQARFLTRVAHDTPEISNESVSLVVTSPPFLDVVNYAQDNWLRAWFNDIDLHTVPLTMLKSAKAWEIYMAHVFHELYRICKPEGHVAFEVGEIRKNTLNLDQSILRIGQTAGFQVLTTYINQQNFTKTANIWGIANNIGGTNTNRIVLFKK